MALTVIKCEGVKDAGFRIQPCGTHTAIIVYEGKDPFVGDLDDSAPPPSIKIPPHGLAKTTGRRRNIVEHTIHINTNLKLTVATGHAATVALAEKFVRKNIQLISTSIGDPTSSFFYLVVKNSVSGRDIGPEDVGSHTVKIDPGDTLAFITLSPTVALFPSDDA